MSDHFKFSCAECGTILAIDEANPPDDEQPLICTGCGHDFGAWGVLRPALVDAAKAEVDRLSNQVFGAKPKWRK